MASRGEALSYGDRPIHPGQYLAEELEARSMTQKALAERMGRPLKTISEIINGKKVHHRGDGSRFRAGSELQRPHLDEPSNQLCVSQGPSGATGAGGLVKGQALPSGRLRSRASLANSDLTASVLLSDVASDEARPVKRAERAALVLRSGPTPRQSPPKG